MSRAVVEKRRNDIPVAGDTSYFTVFVGGEIFGLSVQNTQTIFRVPSVTSIPGGPPDIVGLVNLRGKVVTAVSLSRRLKIANEKRIQDALAIGIEHKTEYFALIVDQVGDVIALDDSMRIAIPPHFDPERLRLTTGLYKVGTLLIPVLNIDALFDFSK